MIPLSFYSIPVLMVTALIIVITGFRKERFASYIALAGSFVAAIFSAVTIFRVFNSGTIVLQVADWSAPFGISIVADSLSVVFVAIASVIGFFALLFSQSYIKNHKTEYYALVCLMLAGLLGVIHTGDLFNMFVFFEIMSVASYALVAFYRNRKSLEASIKYLIMGAFATSLILFGIALIYGSFGTVNMADLASKTAGYTGFVLPVAIGLMFTGFILKTGLVPFHTWLPDAYPAAPSPVTALFSGITIKAGIYIIIRVGFTVFGAPAVILTSLAVIGAVSMIVGGVLALLQSDLKRLLAYSSISQMGYIALALGLGTQMGISGGLFHILNHAIISSLLFLCAGVVIRFAKTSDLYKIAGTIKSSPLLTYTFLIGILSLGGIPFLNGFASKWLIYVATAQINPLLTVFTLLVSVLTMAYGLKAFYAVFMSNPNPGAAKIRIPLTMGIPLVVLAGLCIILGVVPYIGYYMTDFALQGLGTEAYIVAVLG